MPIQARKQGHLIYTVDWSSGFLSPVGGGELPYPTLYKDTSSSLYCEYWKLPERKAVQGWNREHRSILDEIRNAWPYAFTFSCVFMAQGLSLCCVLQCSLHKQQSEYDQWKYADVYFVGSQQGNCHGNFAT